MCAKGYSRDCSPWETSTSWSARRETKVLLPDPVTPMTTTTTLSDLLVRGALSADPMGTSRLLPDYGGAYSNGNLDSDSILEVGEGFARLRCRGSGNRLTLLTGENGRERPWERSNIAKHLGVRK